MSSSGVLGTLVVRIAAEIRQYKENLDTAASATTETAKKIERANADVEKSQERLISSSGAMGAAVGLAAAAAAAALGVMVKGAIDNADAVSKLSAKTGIATETISAYQHAASMSNVSNETLAMGMKALSKNIAEGSEVLGRMGISTKDSQGNLRSLDDVMGDVADKFKGYKDGAGKAALAQEALGRSGMDMIPMLNEGRAGLERMRAEAEALGLVIDGQTGAAAEAFNDNLSRLHASSQGYAASLAAQLLPALTAVTESLIEGGKNSGFMRGAVDVLAGSLKGLISIGYGVGAVFEQIGTYFGGIAAAAAAMLRGDFSQVKTIFGDLSKDLSDKAAASGARINQVWSAIGDGVKKAGAEMDQVDAPGKLEKVGKAAKATATEAERMAAAGAKLAESLLAQESGLSGDFAQKWEQLGAAYEAGEISLEKLVAAQAALLAKQPAMVAAAKAEQKVRDELAKTMEDYAKATEAGVATSIAAAVQAEAELAQYGMLKSEVQALTLAHLEQSRELAALAGEDVSNIEKRIDAQKRLIAATQGLEAKNIARESAKEAQNAWQKDADQINQSLSDALMNGFTAGKGFAQSFVDSVKAMFNTMVLRPVISAIVTGATGSLGLTGTAGAATSGLGNVGRLSSLAGIGGSFGAGVGAGFSSLIGEAGIMGGLDAGVIAMQAGNIAGGLGTLAGVLGPIALGIGAVYALAKQLDHSGTPHTGAGTSYSAASGLAQASAGASGAGLFSSGIAYDSGTEQMTTGLVKSIVQILDSTATAFGKQAGYQAAASFADDSSKDGAYAALNISKLGQVITDFAVWKGHGQVLSDGAAGSAEFLARAAADVRTALDDMDLPGWAENVLRSLGDSPSLQQLADAVDKINQVQSAIASQRAGLQQQYDLLTGVTTQREIERNALDESNRALYDQITALQDQKAATEAAAEAAKAVAQERAGLQQQLDLLTGVTTQREIERNALDESNQALYDQVQALKDQKDASEAAAEAAKAAAQERTGLENTLLQALGETATLRARELDALTPANRGLQEQINTVNDAKNAIASLTSDIARLDQVAKQAATLSNSIGVMLGGTDNTEAGLWATVNNASATAEDKLSAISSLMGIINSSITADTQEAQRLLTEGARQAQTAIEEANAAQQAGANAQLEAAQKMAELGQQLRDYVQGLRLGSSSALTPGQRLALAARDYQTSLSGARAGDQQAMAALQGHAGTYLELARQYDAGSYAQVFADVTGALDSFGGSLMSEGQQQAATAQATLASIQSVSASSAATTEAVLAGNVISDANRQALEMLLGLSTQIQADAAIEKAAKQAQVTAETNRMEAIRTSLSDTGVIALGVTSTAQVMTDFASQQKVDNAALLKQVAELTQRIADLEMNTVTALGGVAGVVQQAGSDNAQVVAQAVATAVSEAADKVVIA